MNPTLATIILGLYNAAFWLCCGFIELAGSFNKEIREHLKLRMSALSYFKKNPLDQCTLFFCSSAGEYEQALPLIHKMEARSLKVVILFFSPSGLLFAKKRKEHRPYFLAPLDKPKYWQKLFKNLNPTHTFIVRHELWPNFAREASKHSDLHLIDASINANSIIKKTTYRLISKYFKNVFAVSLYDYNTLKFLCQPAEVHLSGDTKYDRVLERKNKHQSTIDRYKERLNEKFPGKNYLIIGSAWPKDTEIVLQSWRLLSDEEAQNWRVFIAPHDISDSMLELQSELVRRYGFVGKSYDEFKKEDMSGVDVVIVNKLGILFELYGGFDLAFVGGACHHKIHNVLEPAIYGAHLGFGPRYHNQKEAKFIAEKELAQIITSPEQGAEWLKSFSKSKPDHNNKLIKYMNSLMGAAEQIDKTL